MKLLTIKKYLLTFITLSMTVSLYAQAPNAGGTGAGSTSNPTGAPIDGGIDDNNRIYPDPAQSRLNTDESTERSENEMLNRSRNSGEELFERAENPTERELEREDILEKGNQSGRELFSE